MNGIFDLTDSKAYFFLELVKSQGADFLATVGAAAFSIPLIYYVALWMAKNNREETVQQAVDRADIRPLLRACFADNQAKEFIVECIAKIIEAQPADSHAVQRASAAAGTGAILIIGTTVMNFINKLSDPVKETLAMLLKPKRGATYEGPRMQLAFEMIQEKIKEPMRALLEDVRLSAQTALDQYKGQVDRLSGGHTNFYTPDNATIRDSAAKVMMYFALPLSVHDVYQMGLHGNEDLADKFNREMEKLVGSYDEPLKGKLRYIILLARYATINGQVINIFLKGPTHTGKTYFVERFAELMRSYLNMCKMGDYLEIHGEGDGKWKRTLNPGSSVLDKVGPCKNIVQKAKTSHITNLVDEVKFFDDGSKNNDFDAIEPLKKVRNPSNKSCITYLNVSIRLKEVNFFNSNYTMNVPLPDPEKDPVGHKVALEAAQAFEDSFIFMEFPHWSLEKSEDRIREKVEEFKAGMAGKNHPASINAFSNIFEKVFIPSIMESVRKYNPSPEETKVNMKQISEIIREIVVPVTIYFDEQFNKRKKKVPKSEWGNIELEMSEEKQAELGEKIAKGFKRAAGRSGLEKKEKDEKKEDNGQFITVDGNDPTKGMSKEEQIEYWRSQCLQLRSQIAEAEQKESGAKEGEAGKEKAAYNVSDAKEADSGDQNELGESKTSEEVRALIRSETRKAVKEFFENAPAAGTTGRANAYRIRRRSFDQ